MEEKSAEPKETATEGDSLEGSPPEVKDTPQASEVDNSNTSNIDATGDTPEDDKQGPSKPKLSLLKRIRHNVNIYLLLMILVLFIAIGLVIFTYLTSKKESGTTNINSQGLSQSALQQLANSNATVGNPNQVLNVESSAIFAGKVLLRQDLEVAGNLQIGGALTLNDISVSGSGQIGQLQVNQNLSVAGNSSIQGDITIGKSLQVNGSGSFTGAITAPQITTSDFQLNSDLIITHHITAGGSTPSISNGASMNGGGTTSLSGSDTSGSITINTGGSPVGGCFTNVTFSTRFNSTPHVLVTPIGPAAAGLSYYVLRTSSSFSVCDTTTPPSNTSFGFDYWIVE